MGRGDRGQSKALRVASLPRRLVRPQRLGQRRYSVEQIDLPWGQDEVERTNEPGYLGALRQGLTEPGGAYDGKRSRLAIREDIAVDDNGRLSWVRNGGPLVSHGHTGANHLHQLRKLCDQLNEQPLGGYVSQEQDEEGNLTVGYHGRQIDELGNIFTKTYQSELFDSSNPDAAKQAETYQHQLEEQLAEADRQLAESAQKQPS